MTSPYLRTAWYMAAWSGEVGDALLRRRLLDEPVLLFRKQDGTVAAPVFLGIDSGGTRARRVLQGLIAKEQRG